MSNEDINASLFDEVKRLKEESEKMKKVLRFYANYGNYSIDTAYNGHDVISDNGEMARIALFY